MTLKCHQYGGMVPKSILCRGEMYWLVYPTIWPFCVLFISNYNPYKTNVLETIFFISLTTTFIPCSEGKISLIL